MICLRLLSLSGLLYAILACPVQAQVLTGGPYRVGDTILNNGVAEKVVAGPFFENHARPQPVPPSSQPQMAPHPSTPPPVQPGPPRTYPHAQPVPAYPPVLPFGPPYQPLPPAPYQPPTPPQPVPAPRATSDNDDSDPNCCLRPGSELWEQMVDLIRENARLEATVGKLEEISEMRLDAATERAARLREELEQAQAMVGRELQTSKQQHEMAIRTLAEKEAAIKKAAEQHVEKLKAHLQQLENETAEKMEAAMERTTDLEKQLSTTKHHLDEAREREQAWGKERQKLQREISELKKRRK